MVRQRNGEPNIVPGTLLSNVLLERLRRRVKTGKPGRLTTLEPEAGREVIERSERNKKNRLRKEKQNDQYRKAGRMSEGSKGKKAE